LALPLSFSCDNGFFQPNYKGAPEPALLILSKTKLPKYFFYDKIVVG